MAKTFRESVKQLKKALSVSSAGSLIYSCLFLIAALIMCCIVGACVAGVQLHSGNVFSAVCWILLSIAAGITVVPNVKDMLSIVKGTYGEGAKRVMTPAEAAVVEDAVGCSQCAFCIVLPIQGKEGRARVCCGHQCAFPLLGSIEHCSMVNRKTYADMPNTHRIASEMVGVVFDNNVFDEDGGSVWPWNYDPRSVYRCNGMKRKEGYGPGHAGG